MMQFSEIFNISKIWSYLETVMYVQTSHNSDFTSLCERILRKESFSFILGKITAWEFLIRCSMRF